MEPENPPDSNGRNYRTAYLWEEVFERDSLLDILARYIHLQIEEKARRPGPQGEGRNDDLPALSPTRRRSAAGKCGTR